MREDSISIRSSAITDVAFLVGLAPSSLLPISVAELHLYAYLANLVALNAGSPLADWGYQFSITEEGFPFSHTLEEARINLVRRSVIFQKEKGLIPGGEEFSKEIAIYENLTQSVRRKGWLKASLGCVLNLPHGAVRDAINHTPGVAVNLRDGRASALLKDTDLENIYEEFALVKEVLGYEAEDLLQPVIVWLSARVIAEG